MFEFHLSSLYDSSAEYLLLFSWKIVSVLTEGSNLTKRLLQAEHLEGKGGILL